MFVLATCPARWCVFTIQIWKPRLSPGRVKPFQVNAEKVLLEFIWEWPKYWTQQWSPLKKMWLNNDKCLECFCLKVKKPTLSNHRGKECENEKGGCSGAFIHWDIRLMWKEEKKKQNDYFNLKEEAVKGVGEVGEARVMVWRSQGQQIVWERSGVKVELTCLSIGVH